MSRRDSEVCTTSRATFHYGRGLRSSALFWVIVLAGAFSVGLVSAPPARAAGTLTVTTGEDSGPGSLRNAITIAENDPQPDVIEIKPIVSRIDLYSEISINGSLTIRGPRASSTVIHASAEDRIFDITSGPVGGNVTITDLTLTGGHADNGGAISNSANLTLTRVTLTGNEAAAGTTPSRAAGTSGGSGGAIENTGILTITDSTLTDNSAGAGGDGYSWQGQQFVEDGEDGGAGGSGGAIDNQGTLTITDSVLSGNSAGAGGAGGNGRAQLNSQPGAGGAGADGGNGGAINNVYGATATIIDSTLSNNSAGAGGRGGFGGIGTNHAGGQGGPAGDGGSGGAIANAGRLTVTGSTVNGNAAGAGGIGGQGGESGQTEYCPAYEGGNGVRGGDGGDGGGVSNSGLGTFLLHNSTLVGNTAGAGGVGGAGGTGSRPVICPEAPGGDGGDGGDGGNGGDGGGIFNRYDNLSVGGSEISVTVAGNSAGSAGAGGTGGDGGDIGLHPAGDPGAPGGSGSGGNGGGIAVVSSQPGKVTVNQAAGLLLAENTAASGANCSGVVDETGGDHVNLDYVPGGGTGGCEGFPISADPQLQNRLTGNGGLTKTMSPASGGPAVDAIPVGSTIKVDGHGVSVCPAEGSDEAVTDQRGVVRPQGGGCDIGAVELAAGTQQTITFTSTPPSAPSIGGSYTPTATASSGLPVDFSIDPASGQGVCWLGQDGIVHFTAQGRCVIDADQPGNGDFAPALQQQQILAVTPPAITRYVDRDDGVDADNDCTDKTKPCATVGHAVAVSQDNGTILIAPGAYTHDGAELVVDKDLTIRRWDDGSEDPVVIQGTGWIGSNDIDGMHISSGATVTFEDLTVTSERAGGLVSGGTTTVIGSTVTGREGIIASGDLTVINSTVLAQGGADSLHLNSGTAMVIGSTLAGGRITSHGTTTVAGSIVASCWHHVIDAGSNVEPGTSCGFTDPTSHQNSDPELQSKLTDNGGPTATLAPSSGSPAVNVIPARTHVTIDDADYLLCPAAPDGTLTDQRGVLRPQHSRCDVGAVELVTGQQQQVITFTSDAPSAPMVGDTYTPTATAGSGLPVQFSIDPSSDPGACSIKDGVASFDGAGTCVIDADQSGNATFAAAPQVRQTMSIHAPLQVVTADLPNGTVGEHYSTQLDASGGIDSDYRWRLNSGDHLPPGLQLSVSGLISGTPSTAGSFTFTVTVNDPVPAEFTLVIEPESTTGSSTSTGGSETSTGGSVTPTGGSATPTGADTGTVSDSSQTPGSSTAVPTSSTPPTTTTDGSAAPPTTPGTDSGAGMGPTSPSSGNAGTGSEPGSGTGDARSAGSGDATGSEAHSSARDDSPSTITIMPGGNESNGSGHLASTGFSVWPYVLVSMFLALVGAALIMIASRRHPARH